MVAFVSQLDFGSATGQSAGGAGNEDAGWPCDCTKRAFGIENP